MTYFVVSALSLWLTVVMWFVVIQEWRYALRAGITGIAILIVIGMVLALLTKHPEEK